jgi:hypothetical protein
MSSSYISSTISINPEADVPLEPSVSLGQRDNGNIRVNADGSVIQQFHQSFNVGELIDNSTILGSAKTASGSPARGVLTPDTLVRISGMDVRIREAVGLGYLVVDAQGNYSELGKTATTPAATANPQPATAAAESAASPAPFLDSNTATALEFAQSAFHPHQMDSIINSMIDVSTGNPNAASISPSKISESLGGGLTPAQVENVIQAVASGYQSKVDAVLRANGVQDLDAAYNYWKQFKAPELKQALQKTLHGHDVTDWTDLANAYKRSGHVPTPKPNAAGELPIVNGMFGDRFKTYRKGNALMINIGGSEMLLQTAVRLNLVKS